MKFIRIIKGLFFSHFLFYNRVRKFHKILHTINSLEQDITHLSDNEIVSRVDEIRATFRVFLESIPNKDVIKDKKSRFFRQYINLQNQYLAEIFAIVREASKRAIGMRHFDSQIIGGLVLNDNCIAEMKTGEGKTFVATLPACFNAIIGKNVHIITVNDYLAERDCNWMRPVYEFLGLSVGFITAKKTNQERHEEYNKNIVYATNNEIGFDYLRDQMKHDLSEMLLINKSFDFAIVDEVDSVLIDEARTPLIISGENVGDLKLYDKINKIVSKLDNEDFEIDEKHRSAQLTNIGSVKIEEMLKNHGILGKNDELYGVNSFHILNHIIQALIAHKIFKAEKDYIVKDKKIYIIDEFTGRIMDGRRYSEGLHQAIEAKENLEVQKENISLASVTYQNFFRLYQKLAGMTGTALTEAKEFSDIYNLEVVSIPTNKKIVRKDLNDLVYVQEDYKIKAIIERVKKAHAIGQPVLVGTVSIEKSEKIANFFKKEGLNFNILNAKNHEKEAHIIAQAGKFGAITIATNMAGRGTDIKLGGNIDKLIKDLEEEFVLEKITKEELGKKIFEIENKYAKEKEKVIEAGGLLVIGTERHENRRIDNQLKGRSGRQGDPGETQFFISLDDDLIRIFGGEKIKSILMTLGMKADEIMNHNMIDSVILRSQKKIEKMHYEIRKNIKKYDDILNVQRNSFYEQRMNFLHSTNQFEIIREMLLDVIEELINSNAIYLHSDRKEEKMKVFQDIHLLSNISIQKIGQMLINVSESAIRQFLLESLEVKYKAFPDEIKNSIAKEVLIVTFDENWRNHLCDLEHLRESIHLRAFAQKDPFVEYQSESFTLFDNSMKASVKQSVQRIFRVGVEL